MPNSLIRMQMLAILGLCVNVLLSCGLESPFSDLKSQDQLGMNDVSILYPLPTTQTLNSMVGLVENGLEIPDDLWKKLPTLKMGTSNKITRHALRVTALRIDPCFREKLKPQPSACVPQLRIVAQAFVWNPSLGSVVGEDFAMHLFYEISEVEMRNLLKEIVSTTQQFRSQIVQGPLTVHPALTAEGLNGRFGQFLRHKLLSQFAPRSTSRVTFMTLAANQNQWTFGGYRVSNRKDVSNLKIAGTTFTRQTLVSTVTAPVELNSRTIPESQGIDNLNIFSQGVPFLKLPWPQRQNAIFSLHKVENPNFHVADSVDCVSCHMTTINKAWSVAKNLPQAARSQFSFSSTRFDTRNTSTANPRAAVLRAFGYFENKVAISDRTVHETAATLEFLRGQF